VMGIRASVVGQLVADLGGVDARGQ
jgi:hypothetical protein